MPLKIIFTFIILIYSKCIFSDSAFINIHKNYPASILATTNGGGFNFNFSDDGLSYVYTNSRMWPEDLYIRNGFTTVIFDTSSTVKPYRRPSTYALLAVMEEMITVEGENHARYAELKISQKQKLDDIVSFLNKWLDAFNLLNQNTLIAGTISSFDNFLNLRPTDVDANGQFVSGNLTIGEEFKKLILIDLFNIVDVEKQEFISNHILGWFWGILNTTVSEATKKIDPQIFKILKKKTTKNIGNWLFAVSAGINLGQSFTTFIYASELNNATDKLEAMGLARTFINHLVFKYNGSISYLTNILRKKMPSQPISVIGCGGGLGCVPEPYTPKLSSLWEVFFNYMKYEVKIDSDQKFRLLEDSIYYVYKALNDSGYRYRLNVGYDNNGNIQAVIASMMEGFEVFPGIHNYVSSDVFLSGYESTTWEPKELTSKKLRYRLTQQPSIVILSDEQTEFFYKRDSTGMPTMIKGIALIDLSINIIAEQKSGPFAFKETFKEVSFPSEHSNFTGEFSNDMNIMVPLKNNSGTKACIPDFAYGNVVDSQYRAPFLSKIECK